MTKTPSATGTRWKARGPDSSRPCRVVVRWQGTQRDTTKVFVRRQSRVVGVGRRCGGKVASCGRRFGRRSASSWRAISRERGHRRCVARPYSARRRLSGRPGAPFKAVRLGEGFEAVPFTPRPGIAGGPRQPQPPGSRQMSFETPPTTPTTWWWSAAARPAPPRPRRWCARAARSCCSIASAALSLGGAIPLRGFAGPARRAALTGRS